MTIEQIKKSRKKTSYKRIGPGVLEATAAKLLRVLK